MNLNYMNEFICNSDGIPCMVLDLATIDFSEAYIGRKSKETIILKANGGERIETINSAGLVEATYVANLGDAIFYNNDMDIYVPRDKDGQAWKFDSVSMYGYEVTGEPYSFKEKLAINVKSIKMAKLLVEVIEIPTCIKDAWGRGNHQFLFGGATLKQDCETGKISGIDKGAFEETWEIVEEGKKLYKSGNQ